MNIIEDIRSEIRAVQREPSSRDLTILALLFLMLGAVVGGYLLFWKGAAGGWYWIIAGVVLCLFRLITPLFRGVYRVWLAFSMINTLSFGSNSAQRIAAKNPAGPPPTTMTSQFGLSGFDIINSPQHYKLSGR